MSRNENSFFPTDLKNEGVEQRVAMWHYQSWPDQGSPDDPLTFFEIIHSLKAKPWNQVAFSDPYTVATPS